MTALGKNNQSLLFFRSFVVTLDKLGGASAKQKNKKCLFFCICARLAVILDKLGCIRQYAKIKSFYFCTLRSFALILQKH